MKKPFRFQLIFKKPWWQWPWWWLWPCWWQCWWWCWHMMLKENRTLRSGQISSCHSSLVLWLEGNEYLPGSMVEFSFQTKFPSADKLAEWHPGSWMLALAFTCPTGSHHPTAFPTAAIQKNGIDCFGNHCFQFLPGFWLFSDEAIIELMAGEFIQWLSSLPGKGRHLSHLMKMQQPEVGGLRGCDSLNQSELFGTAIPAKFLVTEPIGFPWIA